MSEKIEKLKTDNGFTMIEHELYNWSIRTKKLGKPEMKIFHAIIRKTNGYHRKSAQISLRYFKMLTGIERRNVWTYIKRLLEKGIILRRQGSKNKFGKPVYYYSINKKYCSLKHASDTEHASADVSLTPEPAVKTTPKKNTNIKLKKHVKSPVNKLMNYKLPKQ